MVCLFKLSPEHCFVSTQNCCHIDLWWFSPIIIIFVDNSSHFIRTLRERVSWLLVCLLAFFRLGYLAAKSCFPTLIWVSSENVALSLASVHTDQPSAWLSWESSDWVDLSLTVPWANLRLLPSDNKDQPSPRSSQEPSDLSGLDQGDYICFAQYVLCLPSRIPRLILAALALSFSRKMVQLAEYVPSFPVMCIVHYSNYLLLPIFKSITSDILSSFWYWKYIPGISIPWTTTS
jgi:hypothetical protein